MVKEMSVNSIGYFKAEGEYAEMEEFGRDLPPQDWRRCSCSLLQAEKFPVWLDHSWSTVTGWAGSSLLSCMRASVKDRHQAYRHAGEVGMLLWVRGLAGLVSTLGKDRWAERVGEPVWTGGLECDVSISRAVRQWSPGQAGAVSLPRDLYLI